MKKTILSFILFGFAISSYAQNINIPDANFKAYLLGETSINTNNDTAIQESEASSYTGFLVCNGKGISDLTGIEAFTEIRTLNVANNSITTLALGDKPKLTELYAKGNQITSISILQNNTLHTVDLQTNKLTDVDVFLSRCSGIKELNLSTNELTTLNISSNLALESLECLNNSIPSINFARLASLTKVQIGGNNFTSIDLSANANLDFIEVIGCSDLESLNIANGNNKNFRTVTLPFPPFGTATLFNATNNPKLTCIQVDDATYSTSNWTQQNIDATASYSENCQNSVGVEKYVVQTMSVYPNPASNTIAVHAPSSKVITIISMQGKVLLEKTNSFILNIEGLTPGIYIVQASDGSQVYTSRFIKN